jgi:hypothetical protein
MNNFQERYANPSEIRHTIGANGRLTINNVAGDVELRAVDGDEVVVNASTGNMRSDSLPITVRKDQGALTIEVEKRGGGFAGFGTWFGITDGVELNVSVPKSASVTINTVSADVRSHFLAGEQSYKSVSGDIEVHPDGGKIRAQSVSGDIAVNTAETAELSVSTTSGDVEVAGATIERFDARTVSGDIQLEAGLGVGPVHSIETVSGDVSIESPTGVTVDVRSSMNIHRGGTRTQVAGDGAAQVRVRTLSGDCHVAGGRDISDDNDRRGRKGKHKHERFEQQLERRIQEQVQRSLGHSADNVTFGGEFAPPMPPMPPSPPAGANPPVPLRPPVDQLEVLRALERGEIDVDEASRRLQEA